MQKEHIMNHHENKPTNAHDSWADYYDCVYKLTHGEKYQRFTDLTLGVIRQLAKPPARVADFGAGTGRLAIPLARAGYRVTAVEASAQMCRVLRAKAAAGVDGAAINHGTSCKTNPRAMAQQARVKVAVVNQTICRPVKKIGFDLGVCVFSVLNYLLDDLDLREFACAAAQAIRADGKLLVSFVEDMRPMQQSLNGEHRAESWDRECSVVRNINVLQLEPTLYEYHEQSLLTKRSGNFPYEDRFPLREWSREEVTAQFKAGGFFFESDLSNKFNKFMRTGEVYLLFRRCSPLEMRGVDSKSRPREDSKLATVQVVGRASCLPGGDGFHRVPFSSSEVTDAVERVPTALPEQLAKIAFREISARRGRLTRKHLLQARRSAIQLIAEGGPSDVFYYPACGSDFAYPLRRFSDRCGTFIFCDWTNGTEKSFLDEVKKIKVGRPPGDERDFLDFPLDQNDVKELASLDHLLAKFFPDMPWTLATYLANPASPKGHYAELWVTAADNTPRFVRVFWLAMEGVNLYWKLFAQKRKAPRILCIKNWGHIGGEWTSFGNWQAHLAQVVRDGPRKPELLIAREGDHDWPWTLRVDEFTDWDVLEERHTMMWRREKPASRNQQVGKRKNKRSRSKTSKRL